MKILPNRKIIKDDDYYLSKFEAEYKDFPWLNESVQKKFCVSWIKNEKQNDMIKWKLEVFELIDQYMNDAYNEHVNELEDCIKQFYPNDRITSLFYLYNYMMSKNPDTFKRDGGDYFIIQPNTCLTT